MNNKTRDLLKQRAEILAQELKPAEAGEVIRVVEFALAGEKYGMCVTVVLEVIQISELVRLTPSEGGFAGVINVRSNIIPVFDVNQIIGMPEKGLASLDKVIVAQSGEAIYGMLVDEVMDVRTILKKDLQQRPETFSSQAGELLTGITGDRMAVLDESRLLARFSSLSQQIGTMG